MSKELKINIKSMPPSKNEIDDCKKEKGLKLYRLVIAAIIFFIFAILFSLLEIVPPNATFFSVAGNLLITFLLGLMASGVSDDISLLEPATISEKNEEKITSLLPNDIVEKYLDNVKNQERVLIGLEVDALMSFFAEHYPEIQLEKLISNSKSQR